jgi:bifunctional non-homologous end joining protein LigD
MRPVGIPNDPLEWRPQEPLVTRTPVTIRDPIVEPLWSGTRVLAHVDTRAVSRLPGVRLIASAGIDIGPDEPDLVAAIGGALLADDAVLDGVITDQATRDAAGTAVVTEARISMMGTLMSRDVGLEVRRPVSAEGATTPLAFVAVDLLRLDGQPLLDVPLLERKRLLESVLEQGPLVRVSVMCRPPVNGWVASWQGAGLRGGMLKAANGRYIPGDRTPEWRTITKVGARR